MIIYKKAVYFFMMLLFTFFLFNVFADDVVGEDAEIGDGGFDSNDNTTTQTSFEEDFFYSVIIGKDTEKNTTGNQTLVFQNLKVVPAGESYNFDITKTSMESENGDNFEIELSKTRIENITEHNEGVQGSFDTFYFTYNISNSQAVGNYTGTIFIVNENDENHYVNTNLKFEIKEADEGFSIGVGEFEEVEEATIETSQEYSIGVSLGDEYSENNTGKLSFTIINTEDQTLNLEANLSEFVEQEDSSLSLDTTNFVLSFNESQVLSGKSSLLLLEYDISQSQVLGDYVGYITVFDNEKDLAQNIKITFNITDTSKDFVVQDGGFTTVEEDSITYLKTHTITRYNDSSIEDINTYGIQKIRIQNQGQDDLTLSIVKNSFESESSSNTQTLDSYINLLDSSLTIEAGDIGEFSYEYNITYSVTDGEYSGSFYVEDQIKPNFNQTVYIKFDISTEDRPIITTTESSLEIEGTAGETTSFNEFVIRNEGEEDIEDIDIDILDDKIYGEEYGYELDDSAVDFEYNDEDLEDGSTRIIRYRVSLPSSVQADNYTTTVEIDYDNYIYEIPLTIVVKQSRQTVDIESGKDYENNKITADLDFIDNIYYGFFTIENDGSSEIENLYLELRDDFVDYDLSENISNSFLNLYDNSINLQTDESEVVEFEIGPVTNISVGNYFGVLDMTNEDDEILKSLVIEIKVRGDVSILDIDYNENFYEEGLLELKTDIKNIGVRNLEEVTLLGEVLDYEDGDIEYEPNPIILDTQEIKVVDFFFKIPKDIENGWNRGRIQVDYLDESFYEYFDFYVEKPSSDIEILDFTLNKNVYDCNDRAYVNSRVKNNGYEPQTLAVNSRVEGESNVYTKSSSRTILNPREEFLNNFILDLTGLKNGEYEISTNVVFTDKSPVSETLDIVVRNCEEDKEETSVQTQDSSFFDEDDTLVEDGESSNIPIIGAIAAGVLVLLGILFFV